jgi:hypothetical protein
MVIHVGRYLLLIGGGITFLLYGWVAAGQPLQSASQSTPPTTFPPGIYWLGPREKPVPEAILKNPLVRGVVLRMRWQDIEPQEGSYNWSYFDEEIKRAAQSGKAVSLRFPSGGRNTPERVLNASGVEKFSFTDNNRYHKETFGQELTIPVFWDPIFLEKKKQFIQAWGARYGANPHVASVDVSCANAITNDWNVPARTPQDIQKWRKLGYTAEKLIATCRELLDVTMAAVPGKAVILSIGSVTLDRPQTRVAQGVLEYAYASYPGRFMAIQSNLSAKSPDPGQRQLRGVPQLLFAHRPYTGAQMLLGASRDRQFRMNGGKQGDRKEIFRQAMQTGLNYGVSFLEVYQEDLLNPEFADIIASAATELAKRGK